MNSFRGYIETIIFDSSCLLRKVTFLEDLFYAFDFLKLHSHLPKRFCVICLIESPLEVMKNAFYFILKAPFVLRYLSFVTTLWSWRKNGLMRKINLTSKFMTSQPGLQTVAIHILSNISESKGNEKMKFVQLMENSTRNVFL